MGWKDVEKILLLQKIQRIFYLCIGAGCDIINLLWN